jgi:AraC-like DNA-binding protein
MADRPGAGHTPTTAGSETFFAALASVIAGGLADEVPLYLPSSRLIRAASLLAEGGGSVLDVAAEVGYESQSSLARVVRRWIGETPSAYRQRMRGRDQT